MNVYANEYVYMLITSIWEVVYYLHQQQWSSMLLSIIAITLFTRKVHFALQGEFLYYYSPDLQPMKQSCHPESGKY